MVKLKCQRKVFHDGGGRFGAFTGTTERCKITARTEVATVPEGTKVLVCHHHLREINKRTEIGMHTHAEWFTKEV